MVSEACFFYYGIFGIAYERIPFISLGLAFASGTITECLICAQIQDYAMYPIQELYIYNLYPMEREDLIKVITFMKRINAKDFGIHYFGIVLFSRKFALEVNTNIGQTCHSIP